MKNTKRCLILFSFYDHTGIEAFLEKQAENGWMLDKTSAFGWHFHRIEPKKIHFSVVYFAKASAFDPEPSEAQLAFHDFCEHTGWRLAASNAQMQIFYNEAPDPTPIETDAALEVSAIHAAAKKSHLASYYLLAGLGLLQAALFLSRFFSDPVSILASNANLFTGMCWLLLLTLSVVEITEYHTWHKRAKAAAALNGSFVETRSHQNIRLVILCMMLSAFAFLVVSYGGSQMTFIAFSAIAFVLGITAIVIGTSAWMKKKKLPAKINRSITMILTLVLSFGLTGVLLISIISGTTSFRPGKAPVDTYEYNGWTHKVYHDELPLTIEDLTQTAYDGYSYEIRMLDKSVFLEQMDATQRPRADAIDQAKLDYSITTIKMPFLYELCKKALLDDFARNYGRLEPEDDLWKEAVVTDAAPWEAREAWQLTLGGDRQMHFLLCYDHCIVEIDFGWDGPLTPEQMKTVSEKLAHSAGF